MHFDNKCWLNNYQPKCLKTSVLIFSFMVYKAHFSLNQQLSTKDKIIEILAVEWPLSTKQIHFILKDQYTTSITYQAVHKLLQQMIQEKILSQTDKEWKINEAWAEEKLLFFKRLNTKSKSKASLLGTKITLFALDVNGVLTPEMTHVEFAKNSPHYQEIKDLIASTTMGKIPMHEAFSKISKLVAGVSLYDIVQYSKYFELMPGVEEFILQLHQRGITLGLITTGFKIFMDCFNRRLGNPFKFIVCNDLNFVDEKGNKVWSKKLYEIIDRDLPEELKKIKVESIKIEIKKQESKTEALREYLNKAGLSFSNVCCVGDSMGDADFIKVAAEEGGIGIAFNPNLSLLEYARFLQSQGKNVKIVESKDMRDILDLFI